MSVAPPPAPPAGIPWLGLVAVLMGTFISTLNGRLSSFGLADIRGALGIGFDEGAWITTAQTVAQMMVAPVAVWMGSVFGPRRLLMAAALSFAAISLIIPLSPNLSVLLALQFLGGCASGFFVPLTLSFILRSLPLPMWAFGVALYALNLEFSLNISASLEGWYIDHLNWHWIFWQTVPLSIAMALTIHYGVKRDAGSAVRRPPDIFGLASCGIGLALIYAALDQGNRLDWLNSGLVVGLLLAGALLLAAFLMHEARTPHPWLDLRVAFAAPLPRLLVLVAFLRLTILGTAVLVPQYLGAVRGFRALEAGDALIWLALPQFILCPMAAIMLRRTDARITAATGFVFISCACLIVAHEITPAWGPDEFLATQLLQAVGQSLALSGVLFVAILHLRPQDALTFGAMVQIARLMGGECGVAFIATFVRMREQRASNLIGQHLQAGDSALVQRLQAYAGATARAGDPTSGPVRGATVLAGVVRRLATTQGLIDAFMAIAVAVAVALLVLALLREPPRSPASHIPLWGSRRARRATTSAAAGLLLIVLAGCTVGPDYKAPAPPDGATTPLASASSTASEPPDQWWRLYRDPELDRLITEAFAANQDLAAAEANLAASRAIFEAARSREYPSTTVEGGGIYGRDPETNEILLLGGHKPQSIWLFDSLIDVSYEVDLFGHVRHSIEAEAAGSEASLASRDAVRVTLAAETARAYAEVCALGEELGVARRSVALVGREAEIARARHQAGASSEYEVARAEGLLAQAKAVVPPLEGQRRAALFQLAALLGRVPSKAPEEALDCQSPPRLASTLPAGDGAALLRRRPDVRAAERALAASVARVGVATADLYPRISLTGFWGGAADKIDLLDTGTGLAWGIGPSIRWSFPNQALPRARVAQAEAAATGALAQFDAAVLRALKETEQALSVYAAELEHNAALVDFQAKEAHAFALARDQFGAGSVSNLDLLTTEQALIAADAAVAQSDAAVAQDQIAVFKALGGGWQKPGDAQVEDAAK
jgi:DHA2 family multidrug resistance protein